MATSLTVSLESTIINSKENLLYFGSLEQNQKEEYLKKYKNLAFSDEVFVSQVTEKIELNYKYCEKIYKNLIADLTNRLNLIHQITFSEKKWEIIFGDWLKNFVYICYKNFSSLEQLTKKNDFEKIYYIDHNKKNLISNSDHDLHLDLNDGQWNEILNCKIIDFLDLKSKKIKISAKNKILKKNYSSNKSISSFLKKIGFLSLKIFRIFKKNNDGLIFLSGLNFINEKRLELALGQFPQAWEIKSFKFNNDIDKHCREKITLNQSNISESFEKFLRKILPSSLPKYLIENFQEINKLSKKIGFPENPKFIFTAHGSNEVIFNFYWANKIKNNFPYIILQHGHTHITHIMSKYRDENNHANYILSWGAKKNNKEIPLFNINVIGKEKHNKHDGVLGVFCQPLHQNSNFSEHSERCLNEKNLNFFIKKFSQINQSIKKQTFFKLFPDIYYKGNGLFEKKLISNGFKLTKQEKYFEILKSTRLNLFLYDSTGILENLALNIPTIAYLNGPLTFLEKEYQDIYTDLIKGKIIFDNIENLICHIENIWPNINSWWEEDGTQKKIKNFNKKINIPYQNNFEKISKEIKKIIN
tara:strand:- start:12848 stop:14605 length:1758 start_codon:yes stop_codon:yes gene_type:complete